MSKHLLFYCVVVTCLSSCKLFQKTAKHDFDDGYYIQQIAKSRYKVYADIVDGDLKIYPLSDQGTLKESVTSEFFQIYPAEIMDENLLSTSFVKNSFDLDFLTIPFKFRPAVSDIPHQLNTSINGALFLGFRKDIFEVAYTSSPLGNASRSINHFGFSTGFFSGLGSTPVNNFTTSATVEYDGLIWSNGIAGIVAVNNFTFGVALGIDHLTDKYRTSWVYNRKPWVGLAFGLNLN